MQVQNQHSRMNNQLGQQWQMHQVVHDEDEDEYEMFEWDMNGNSL